MKIKKNMIIIILCLLIVVLTMIIVITKIKTEKKLKQSKNEVIVECNTKDDKEFSLDNF